MPCAHALQPQSVVVQLAHCCGGGVHAQSAIVDRDARAMQGVLCARHTAVREQLATHRAAFRAADCERSLVGCPARAVSLRDHS